MGENKMDAFGDKGGRIWSILTENNYNILMFYRFD